ncbi:MAG TPA: hypothetical protein VFG86_07340 [Chloroflexota bacterium]|jgi:hypothetical protein|nr:hypothetical protein [Chloroflexota bacterium]
MAVITRYASGAAQILPGWRKLLLTAHVLVTVGLFGADLVLLTLGISSVLGADPRTIYPAAATIGTIVLAPLAVTSLASGLLLAGTTHWGLLKYWWVVIKLAITVALTPVVIFVLVPRLDAAALATSGASPRSFSQTERLQLALGPGLASTLLALNVALAVYKPRAQLRTSAE